jgi:hypothetical protein
MKSISEKSLSTLVKELGMVKQDISHLKFHIDNLKNGKVYNYKAGKVIPLTEEEMKNKEYWIKNNTKSLKDSLKLEKEYLAAIRKKAK